MSFGDFLGAAALRLAAGVEVKRLLGLTPAVARRDIKSRDWQPEQLRAFISVLDEIARDGREDSERAAELAEYMEGLL
ncbi:hypothetical protein KGA66_06640 [Actinocrinis puniceicyclus]|uniref:Uncharacterized protein n=1 Tax=Actinocrinis puniceicyclus TaxID=977794 RepID=A0A8J7WNJ1_9ACTN|nr:hypothetical protein [Actinocrinis puniceicyclus]MBS2962715.1 hypothetical protein [Actinocrinis puniceicyclus]